MDCTILTYYSYNVKMGGIFGSKERLFVGENDEKKPSVLEQMTSAKTAHNMAETHRFVPAFWDKK